MRALGVTTAGLTSAEAERRLEQYGHNVLEAREKVTPLRLFLEQLKSPLVLILVFASVISAVAHEWVDATIVIVIVLVSAILGFLQEYRASAAVEKLRAQVTKTNLLRDGQVRLTPAEEVVPGDVVLLGAGSLVPADGMVLEAKDFFVSQAVLTGETFPVEKKARCRQGAGQPCPSAPTACSWAPTCAAGALVS